jgi:hypothetical protein
MEPAQADPRVVQQLMFNRILSCVRLSAIEGVTVVGFDSKRGTLACSLAGVNFLVSVSVRVADPATPGST